MYLSLKHLQNNKRITVWWTIIYQIFRISSHYYSHLQMNGKAEEIKLRVFYLNN